MIRPLSAPGAPPSAVCLGNFEGLHLGHLSLIKVLKREAEKRALKPTALLFAPPTSVLKPEPVVPLMNLCTKALLLEALLGEIRIAHFTPPFATQDGETFLTRLREQLNMRALVFGPDARVGRDRLNAEGIKSYLSAHETEALTIPPNPGFSSTKIRELLSSAPFFMDTLKPHLGRPWAFCSRVLHGRKLGRTLGFPTLNLLLPSHFPLSGVYSGLLWCESSKEALPAAADAAALPEGVKLEIHAFKPLGEIYGQRVWFAPFAFLRRRMQFDSLEALKAQIDLDVQRVKESEPLHTAARKELHPLEAVRAALRNLRVGNDE